jgi:hypothetical protein
VETRVRTPLGLQATAQVRGSVESERPFSRAVRPAFVPRTTATRHGLALPGSSDRVERSSPRDHVGGGCPTLAQSIPVRRPSAIRSPARPNPRCSTAPTLIAGWRFSCEALRRGSCVLDLAANWRAGCAAPVSCRRVAGARLRDRAGPVRADLTGCPRTPLRPRFSALLCLVDRARPAAAARALLPSATERLGTKGELDFLCR